MTDRGKPLYMIGVVAEMLKLHPQTLRLYERKGLIRPSRTVGKTRMYSAEDVEEIGRVLRLTRDLGVNLAGVELILRMRSRMLEMQKQMEDLLDYVRQEMSQSRDSRSRGTEAALVRAAAGTLKSLDVFS
ncbi:MAG: helix-turn-helix transcriptional regulator [candidate division NC10 bacterium]